MGVFVTFEGPEGCGKSTQIVLLSRFLADMDVLSILTREPGGSNTGKKIRELLLNSQNCDIKPKTELLLYASDRAQHIEEVINPALEEGKTVLCDRFTDATIAYQGYGRGIDLQLISDINALATGNIKPDLTYFIDCPVEIGIKRAFKRAESETLDEMRFEKEEISFHEKVREGYRKISESEPERVFVVDGTESIDEVHKACVDIYKRKFGENIA